jgi:hypothetical protein
MDMSSENSLGVYREPVRKYLFSEIKRYGHDPKKLKYS